MTGEVREYIITHLEEEQHETHPGTLQSFYEQEIPFIRRHETHFTTAKAEYLTTSLRNEQQNWQTRGKQQLSGTQRLGDKHETLEETLKGAVFRQCLTPEFKGDKKNYG